MQADSRADKDTITYLQNENRQLTNKCDTLQRQDAAEKKEFREQIEKEIRMQLQQEYADKERDHFSKMEEEIKHYRQQADDYKDKYINLLEKQAQEKK